MQPRFLAATTQFQQTLIWHEIANKLNIRATRQDVFGSEIGPVAYVRLYSDCRF